MSDLVSLARSGLLLALLLIVSVGCSSGPTVPAAPAETASSAVDVAEPGDAPGNATTAATVSAETGAGESGAGEATAEGSREEGGAQASGAGPGSGATGTDADAAARAAAAAAAGEILPLEPSDHPLVGMPAPDLTMVELASGQPLRLASYAGRPVAVNWWATWCVPCRVEMPWLQVVRDANADAGFEVLLADAGEKVPPSLAATTISRFVDSIGLTLPVLYGENTYEVQEAWTVGALPITFLIDKDGVVADVRSGGYPNQATLADHVRRVLLEPE